MNENIEVEMKLSSQGLRNIRLDLHEMDFEFLVGKKSYKCNSLLAEYLSPKICRLRSSDVSVSQYRLSTPDPSSNFDRLLSLAFGAQFNLSFEDFPFFLSASQELENRELLSLLVSSRVDGTELTTSNAVSLLQQRQLMCFEKDCDSREISFIASHFCEIDVSDLDLNTLRRILCDVSLRLESEDWLYKFICSLIEKDESFIDLLEFVHFEYLSVEVIEDFISFSDSFIFDRMNSSLWKSICRRLSLKPSLDGSTYKNEQRSRYGRLLESKYDEFPLDRSKPLNGIISHLSKKFGGNVHDKGVVNITADRPYYGSDPSYAAKNIADLEVNSCFDCANAENMWICYDFKDRKVILSAYSLRSHYNDDNCNLKSWAIEVSLDGVSWQTADTRSNNDLHGRNRTVSYELSNPVKCRYVRLRQTGKNHAGHYDTYTSSFELFGQLTKDSV